MTKKILPLVLLLLLAAVGVVYLFTTPLEQDEQDEKLNVVTTILPLATLAQSIGGDAVKVNALVPPGASPHTYEPTPDQLREVASASLLIAVGTPVEFEVTWLDRLISLNPEITVVRASEGINLIEVEEAEEEEDHDEEENEEDEHGHEGGIDPHTWLSPANLLLMTDEIEQAFINADPERAEEYRNNADLVRERLQSIDERIRDLLADADKKKILVYHDAWGYFARDYGLELIEIEVRGKEPTAAGIHAAINLAKVEGIEVVFASPEFPAQSAQVIADAIGGRVVRISPIPADIFDALERAAEAFSESF